MRNIRQQSQRATESAKSSLSQIEEEGVKAIEEMEESIMNAVMPNEGDDDQELNERERRARAAITRFGSVQYANAPPASSPAKNGMIDDWMLGTHIEDDIDELMQLAFCPKNVARCNLWYRMSFVNGIRWIRRTKTASGACT